MSELGSRILVVDCYLDDLGGARNVTPHFESTEILRAAHDPLPDRLDADGIVVTGSAASVLDNRPWAVELEGLVAEAVEREVPLLGLCFGHQVLARACFGRAAVRLAPSPELGWTSIRRTAEDALLESVADKFDCFVSHKDEVDAADASFQAGALLLASTESCAVEAFRVRNRRAWGVQFHAEMGLEESTSLIESRLASEPEARAKSLAGAAATPDLASRLFRNFQEQVEARV